MKTKEKIILLFFLIANLFVRTYGLDRSPPSLNFDEAALGYNAYSLMKTGKDEYGNLLPLSLRSFNDYKPALYAYLTVPFVYFFGLNEITTRLVSAVFGTISLFFWYFILRRFVKNEKIRWFCFLMVSLEPWRVHFSRNAYESNLSMSFFTAGACFLMYYEEIKNKFLVWIAGIMAFILAVYGYHSARVAAPIFLVLWSLDPLLLVTSWKYDELVLKVREVFTKKLILFLVFFVLIAPIFLVNKTSLVLTRFKQENVFVRYFPYASKELVDIKGNVWLSAANNPVYYLLGMISGHVISYISPINLGQRIFNWVRGSNQYIGTLGMFTWIELIFFTIGLVIFIQKLDKKDYRVLLYWMVAGAAPSAVTWNWFHPLRGLNLFPALEIIAALGVGQIWLWMKDLKSVLIRTSVAVLCVGVVLVSTVFTINNEYGHGIWENNGEYQPGGFKEGLVYLKEIQGNYDRVYIDSPHAQSYILFLFYQAFPPEEIQKYADKRPAPGVEGDLSFNFYNYIFEKYPLPRHRDEKKVAFWIPSSVNDDEVKSIPGAKKKEFKNVTGYVAATVVTID